jgi:hypothetical protein
MLILLATAPENPLDSAAWIFPALEVWHILGFAVSIGTIALVDFRLLGFGMTRQTPGELSKQLAPWTLFGLASMLLSGGLMFATDPDMYYLNHAFQVKITLMALAVLIHYTIRRRVVVSEGSAGKILATVSLLLWAGVLGGGILIGFLA